MASPQNQEGDDFTTQGIAHNLISGRSYRKRPWIAQPAARSRSQSPSGSPSPHVAPRGEVMSVEPIHSSRGARKRHIGLASVDVADATDPLAHDEFLSDFPLRDTAVPIAIEQIYLRDTARLRLAVRKGLKISDLRKDRDSGLITWDGIELDILESNRCLPPDQSHLSRIPAPDIEDGDPVEQEEEDEIDHLHLKALKASLTRLGPARAEVWDLLSTALESDYLTQPLLRAYCKPIIQQVVIPFGALNLAKAQECWAEDVDGLMAHLKTIPYMMCKLRGVQTPLSVNDGNWISWWFSIGVAEMRKRSITIARTLITFKVATPYLKDTLMTVITSWLDDPVILQQINAQKALRACLEPNPESGRASRYL